MQPTLPVHRFALRALIAAFIGVLAVATAARATDEKTITNAVPASAVAPPTAVRTMKFTTHHAVPATLTLRRETPVESGWKPQFRFKGQTEFTTCEFNLPKTGQSVQQGETATGTIVCTTPWQLYDNGLAFEAFEGGRKVADGTLRP
jgi:translation elongation factor EF-Tu-like GTPase